MLRDRDELLGRGAAHVKAAAMDAALLRCLFAAAAAALAVCAAAGAAAAPVAVQLLGCLEKAAALDWAG